MSNCSLIKSKGEFNNNDIPLLNEVMRLHCVFTESFAQNEMYIMTNEGQGADLVFIGGGGITAGGVHFSDKFHINGDTVSGTGTFDLGEYDVAICTPDNSIKTLQIQRPGFSLKNYSHAQYYDAIKTIYTEAQIVTASPLELRDLDKLLEAFPAATTFRFLYLRSGNIENIYGRKFTTFYIDYSVLNGDKHAERIYESICALNESLTTKYVLPNSFTFKNLPIEIAHNVTFDGQGGCQVKKNDNTVIGAFDGTSWTYYI